MGYILAKAPVRDLDSPEALQHICLLFESNCMKTKPKKQQRSWVTFHCLEDK